MVIGCDSCKEDDHVTGPLFTTSYQWSLSDCGRHKEKMVDVG